MIENGGAYEREVNPPTGGKCKFTDHLVFVNNSLQNKMVFPKFLGTWSDFVIYFIILN